MSVTITDCTIRDGGYLFNKNSDPEFVKGIMKGLADAGIPSDKCYRRDTGI